MDIAKDCQTEWMEKTAIRLGITLEDIMREKGVTTVQLASKVGMLPSVLEKYLSGSEQLSVGMYDLLLAHLDYRLDVVDMETKEVFLPQEDDYVF